MAILPADRMTTWNPGLNSIGGIPSAGWPIYTTLSPSGGDDTPAIQNAINLCPTGQVVRLNPGTFSVGTTGAFVLISNGVVLRGAGMGQTILRKSNGATFGSYLPGPNQGPLVIIGPAQWDNNAGVSTNLTADAVKGAFSVTVTNPGLFSAGQYVLLDELSGAAWQTDPGGRGQIWASADFRVVWQRHNPGQGTDDPWPDAASWFCRFDRPTNEIKQVDHVSGSTVFFTTPIHISYRTAQTAQLSTFGYAHTQLAGIEDLTVSGGDDGNIRFHWAAHCWARNVENTAWLNEGFAVVNSFKVEIRESYVHDACWPEPGGGGYAISLSNGSSEVLVENSISFKANKVMVARCSGTASVFGYNYCDDGYILGDQTWIEIGLNASHMVGPHHVLFEGNYGFNFDSDKTHGNSVLHTVFRNHLRGIRRDFNDATTSNGPKRCAGAGFYSYWMSYVGNVLGADGQMGGWVYQTGDMGTDAIYLLGWDDWSPYPVDANVGATAIRHGNWDYLTNSVIWDGTIADHVIPDSYYLTGKPAFFGALQWPWVDSVGSTKTYQLPARIRFDSIINPQWGSTLGASSSVTASLSTAIQLAAGLAATSTVTANLRTPLDASLACRATVTADLATATPTVGASLTAVASVVAIPWTDFVANLASSAVAELITGARFEASPTASSTLLADLETAIALAATLQGNSTLAFNTGAVPLVRRHIRRIAALPQTGALVLVFNHDIAQVVEDIALDEDGFIIGTYGASGLSRRAAFLGLAIDSQGRVLVPPGARGLKASDKLMLVVPH